MMNKHEIIKAVARMCPKMTKKDIGEVLDGILFTIEDCLAYGEQVDLLNFGSFRVVEYKERYGTNPKTGERIFIPARKVPVFRPGKRLRDEVDN